MTERIASTATPSAARRSALARKIAGSISSTWPARRADFVAFVRKRVHDAATAEDIVSETLARALSHANELRDEKALVAWLYRALRNAVVDHHRRRAAGSRALEQWASTTPTTEEPLRRPVCACVRRVAAALKPEYAKALERIEVDGEALRAFAAEVGISPANAAVRVFRAREALRRGVLATCRDCARDGCVDCTCGPGASGTRGPGAPPRHAP